MMLSGSFLFFNHGKDEAEAVSAFASRAAFGAAEPHKCQNARPLATASAGEAVRDFIRFPGSRKHSLDCLLGLRRHRGSPTGQIGQLFPERFRVLYTVHYQISQPGGFLATMPLTETAIYGMLQI